MPTDTKKHLFPYNDDDKIESIKLSKNEKNFIYFMVDATTGFDVTSILQANDDQLGQEFTGFTNYLNLTTVNHATNASIPNLFGGFAHTPYEKNLPGSKVYDLNFLDYMRRSIGAVILPFAKNGYDTVLINPQYYHYKPELGYWTSDWQEIEKDFAGTGLKCFTAADLSKYMLKNYPELYADQELPKNVYEKDTNVNDMVALDYLPKIKIETTDKPQCMIFMTESNHRPYVVDENGKYHVGENDAQSTYNSTKGLLLQLKRFVNYLQENGIYDNTMICIVSDHGAIYDSLPIQNDEYNHTGISYDDIRKINDQFKQEMPASSPNKKPEILTHIIPHYPTMLIKPYHSKNKIYYDNGALRCNTDALGKIVEYHPEVKFEQIENDNTKRFAASDEAIANRKLPIPSYGADSKWTDDQQFYKQSVKKQFGHDTFLISNNIYELKNYEINKINPFTNPNKEEFCNPDNPEHWKPLSSVIKIDSDNVDSNSDEENDIETDNHWLQKVQIINNDKLPAFKNDTIPNLTTKI